MATIKENSLMEVLEKKLINHWNTIETMRKTADSILWRLLDSIKTNTDEKYRAVNKRIILDLFAKEIHNNRERIRIYEKTLSDLKQTVCNRCIYMNNDIFYRKLINKNK